MKSVWRKAAEIVDDSRGFKSLPCCDALGEVLPLFSEWAVARNKFAAIFRDVDPTFLYWWEPPYVEGNPDRNARVLALLLMQEIEKDGQR